MTCVVYKITACLLVLAVVRSTGVQPKQIIYVDERNGKLDPRCWDNKPESQSECVEVAIDCAEQYNSTIVVVKQKCKNASAADVPDGTPCPTWFLPDSSANDTCRCGNDIHGAVICNDTTKEVAILNYYCMTYSESTGPVVGACFYNSRALGAVLYHPLPSNIMELN